MPSTSDRLRLAIRREVRSLRESVTDDVDDTDEQLLIQIKEKIAIVSATIEDLFEDSDNDETLDLISRAEHAIEMMKKLMKSYKARPSVGWTMKDRAKGQKSRRYWSSGDNEA